MIEVKNLVKRYGSFVAVDHLDFTVERGSICGFLGPNGAGKSTTMNMMTGYLAPTSGTVTIDGFDIQEEPREARRRIGYLPEIPPVYLDMTPEEYLAFAGELKGVGRGGTLGIGETGAGVVSVKGRGAGSSRRVMLRAEVERVMEAVGITSMGRRLIRNLSKGYRQRVGFACALLGDPEVIILDEPTVGLDPRQITEIRDLIRSLGGSHTVILSSHILSEVSAVCDHILILSKGKLVARDTPENLTRRMQRTNVYDLLVDGEPEQLKSLLGQAEGLLALETGQDPSGQSGLTAVHLETAGDVDPRAQVFRLLAKADCPIMELTSRTVSLEDVFLELTGAEASGQENSRVSETETGRGSSRRLEAGTGQGNSREPEAGTGQENSRGPEAETGQEIGSREE